MPKVTSAGIIVKYDRKYVLGHATGNKHFDIFKGKMEEGETPIQAALRETEEESGLVIPPSTIEYLGCENYNKTKNLELFIAQLNNVKFDINNLSCYSTFEEDGEEKKEMDYYGVFDFDTMVENSCKSLRKILLKWQDYIERY